MIYLVLGMHKSGTTLVSEILHHSGIPMGDIDTSLTYDDANQYEDQESLHLNMELIGAPDYEVLHLKAPDPPVATPEQTERMRRFIADRSARDADWGFKDPRTALVYPLWEQELPEHRIIAVWRYPEEVWPRFAAPGPGLYHQEPKRAWSFVQRWCEYNQGMLDAVAGKRHSSIVLNYGEFMSNDSVFMRLQDFVGIPLQDRRRKSMYRSRRKRHPSYEIAKRIVRTSLGYDPDAIVRRLEAV
ncbi:MAG TPA: sulfotransferase [bacterium]|nr:sulfotransferase [bacterium]